MLEHFFDSVAVAAVPPGFQAVNRREDAEAVADQGEIRAVDAFDQDIHGVMLGPTDADVPGVFADMNSAMEVEEDERVVIDPDAARMMAELVLVDIPEREIHALAGQGMNAAVGFRPFVEIFLVGEAVPFQPVVTPVDAVAAVIVEAAPAFAVVAPGNPGDIVDAELNQLLPAGGEGVRNDGHRGVADLVENQLRGFIEEQIGVEISDHIDFWELLQNIAGKTRGHREIIFNNGAPRLAGRRFRIKSLDIGQRDRRRRRDAIDDDAPADLIKAQNIKAGGGDEAQDRLHQHQSTRSVIAVKIGAEMAGRRNFHRMTHRCR